VKCPFKGTQWWAASSEGLKMTFKTMKCQKTCCKARSTNRLSNRIYHRFMPNSHGTCVCSGILCFHIK
jgi:hypothetical protein